MMESRRTPIFRYLSRLRMRDACGDGCADSVDLREGTG
jgi:hypothetical protein